MQMPLVVLLRQVVGCIVEHEGKVLLCRRAIEPCKGKWTIPAGFLEMGESTAGATASLGQYKLDAASVDAAPVEAAHVCETFYRSWRVSREVF